MGTVLRNTLINQLTVSAYFAGQPISPGRNGLNCWT
jgi:hypothetical protein